MIKLVKSVLNGIPEIVKGELTGNWTSNMQKPEVTFYEVDAVSFEEAVATLALDAKIQHEVTINRYKYNIPNGYAVYYLQDDWT